MNEIAPLLYISMDSVVGRGLAPAVLRLYLIFSVGPRPPYI